MISCSLLLVWHHALSAFQTVTWQNSVGVCAVCSILKVGCMVFLVHDINDIFMEAAKMARYAGRSTLCTSLFVTFMITWFASRIYYFPVYIIRSTLTECISVGALSQ